MKRKLMIGFAAILLLFAAVSAIHGYFVQQINEHISRQQDAAEKKIWAQQLKIDVTELAVLQYGLMLSGDKSTAAMYREIEQRFMELVQRIGETADTAEKRGWRAQLSTTATEFAATFDSALAAMDEEGTPEALRSRMEQMYSLSRVHREYIFELTDLFYTTYTEEEHIVSAATLSLLRQSETASQATATAAFPLAALLAWLLIRSFVKPIRKLQQAMALISQGDLRHRIGNRSKDELGQLSRSFDEMIDKVRHMLHNTSGIAASLSAQAEQSRQFSEQTSSANNSVFRSISEISVGAAQQATDAEQLGVVSSELEQRMSHIAAQTGAMRQQCEKASIRAADGGNIVASLLQSAGLADDTLQQTVASMTALAGNAKHIGTIIDTISDIAGQTNILALNASIESARAGVHGKGFSVIADQVRLLSQQTATAARSVEHSIVSLLRQMKEVEAQMEETRIRMRDQSNRVAATEESFRHIEASITAVASGMLHIDSETREASQWNLQLAEAIQTVAAVAEQTAAGTEQVHFAAEKQDESLRKLALQTEQTEQLARNLQAEIRVFALDSANPESAH